jgi:hypothetical protein
MEISDITLVVMSSLVVITSLSTIIAVNCRRRQELPTANAKPTAPNTTQVIAPNSITNPVIWK